MIGLGPSYRTVESRCPLCGHKQISAVLQHRRARDAHPDIALFGPIVIIDCRRGMWLRFEPELVARVERARAAILSMDRRGMGDGSA
jgi:hypothetical protein